MVDAAVAAAVRAAHHREWGFVLAATVRSAGGLDLAEECVQEAYATALTAWGRDGIPDRPGAWLTTVARRRALDTVRRNATLQRVLPQLAPDTAEASAHDTAMQRNDEEAIPDERLRLIFTCCHPAIALDAQVALTLRLLCGLSTGDVARAFLVKEPTMAARITRAKRKIAAARIPYEIPAAEDLPKRIAAVLEVVHLLFTTGHTAPAGATLIRQDLLERSIELARMLRLLLPDDADVAALLALILLTDARRQARTDEEGRLVVLEHQRRDRWDQGKIVEGLELAADALSRRPDGRFALMAAIAAVHDRAPTWEETDHDELVLLYDALARVWPSPVVELNRAIAIGLAYGPQAGLDALEPLATEPRLASYGYLAAARGDFLRRLNRTPEALDAYQEALLLTENEAEREFLETRLEELDGH
jgi:RNA polymerase sigma-70 factor (ECF subfamily)